MLLIKQKRLAQTGRTDLWLPRGGGREEKNQEFGVNGYKLLYVENE